MNPANLTESHKLKLLYQSNPHPVPSELINSSSKLSNYQQQCIFQLQI
jgi:hypothetical protein